MRFYSQIIANLLLVAAAGMCALLPFFSMAAEQTPAATPKDSVSSLPSAYIVEMEKFFAYCKDDDYLSKNYDCRCLSVDYIDTRTAKGPGLKSSEILKAMKKEPCRYDKGQPASANTEPAADYGDIPDEYLKEANDFYEKCNATYNLSTNYDCECLSTKFLDTRIKDGPELTESEIMVLLATECPNVEGSAGHVYSQCLTQAPLLPANQSVEKFCTCMANTFAKLYKTAHISAGSQQYTSLQSSAMLMCTELPGGRKFPNLAYPPKPGD